MDKLHAEEIKVSNELSVIGGKINTLLNKLYAEERAGRELQVEVNRLIERDGMPLYLPSGILAKATRTSSPEMMDLYRERRQSIRLYLMEKRESRIRSIIRDAGGKISEASREYYGGRYNESSPRIFQGLVYRHNLSDYARGIRELMRNVTKADRRVIDSQI